MFIDFIFRNTLLSLLIIKNNYIDFSCTILMSLFIYIHFMPAIFVMKTDKCKLQIIFCCYRNTKTHFITDDYDLNFPNTSAYTPIDVGHIDKSLNEFTITVWVLFNVGYASYPLISYKRKNSAQNIAMYFDLDGNDGSTIANLTVKAFNKSVR